MKNSQEQFYAIVAPGFEAVCAEELRQHLHVAVETERGGVTFEGKLRELYLANLWSRCASRIVVRLDSFKCRDFPTLHRKAARLPWGRFIKTDRAVVVRATCHQSRLNHTGRIEETVSDAIDKALGRTCPDTKTDDPQQVLVRFTDDHCLISIDSSGERLHRRGYRQKMTPAPLRETLAAGCLYWCGWTGQSDFYDGMCGSGTLAIEAALIAANMAPGRQRHFAFQQWPGYRDRLWQSLQDEAERQQREPAITITAGDQDPVALEAARSNSAAAGVAQWIQFHQQPFQDSRPSDPQGFWLSNPPYGERLKDGPEAVEIFNAIQRHHQHHYPHWQGAMLLPEPLSGLPQPLLRFRNGGLAVALYPLGNRPD